MTSFIKKYFGSSKNLFAFLIALAVWGFLYIIGAHRGNPDGAAGFAIGFGFAWLILVE